jgi:hypothetical protein
MTPNRSPSLASYAAGNLLHLKQLPVEPVGVATAGVAAVVGWAFGSANVGLLWVVGAAMLLDLVAGAVGAIIDPLQAFSTKKLYGGFIGKLFRVLLIPAVSLIDWLVIASPLPLPEGYAQAFPITALALVGLAAAELTSVLNHLRHGGVDPGLIAVVMRHLDRIRTGAEPPARRDYDAAALAEEADRRRAAKRPDDGHPSKGRLL